jgi:hypothetical protein
MNLLMLLDETELKRLSRRISIFSSRWVLFETELIKGTGIFCEERGLTVGTSEPLISVLVTTFASFSSLQR